MQLCFLAGSCISLLRCPSSPGAVAPVAFPQMVLQEMFSSWSMSGDSGTHLQSICRVQLSLLICPVPVCHSTVRVAFTACCYGWFGLQQGVLVPAVPSEAAWGLLDLLGFPGSCLVPVPSVRQLQHMVDSSPCSALDGFHGSGGRVNAEGTWVLPAFRWR